MDIVKEANMKKAFRNLWPALLTVIVIIAAAVAVLILLGGQ